MDRQLKNALGKVHAEDALVRQTAARLSAEIRRRERSKPVRFRLAAACASLLVLLAVGGLSLNLYLTPSAYIDVDVNPSIGLTTNRFGRVISAHAYNDEGERILDQTSVRSLRYSDALDSLIGAMQRDGYLSQDGLVSITVQSEDASLLQNVRASIDASLRNHHLAAAADVFPVTQDVKSAAIEHHLSPAKYLAITDLQQVDPTATIEGCRDHSIGELRQRAQDHAQGHGSGGDHGEGAHESAPAPLAPAATGAPDSTPAPQSDDHEEQNDSHGGGHHGLSHNALAIRNSASNQTRAIGIA